MKFLALAGWLAWLNAVGQTVALQSEQYKFRHITLDDGLSQVSVRAMLQDRLGFWWLATENGLNRYDGYEFRVFQHDPDDSSSLSSSYIYTMVEARGFLWILTRQGLNRFDPKTGRARRLPPKPGAAHAFSREDPNLHLDRDGFLWTHCGDDGVERIDTLSLERRCYHADPTRTDSLAGGRVSAFRQDSRGRYWVGSDQGLHRFHPETETFTRHPFEGPPNATDEMGVRAIFEDRDGGLWVGSADGVLSAFDAETGTFRRWRAPLKRAARINTVTVKRQDELGRLWLSIRGQDGLLLFNPATEEFEPFLNPADGRPASIKADVWKIMSDRDGVLWIATYGDGLYRYQLEEASLQRLGYDRRTPDGIGGDYIVSMMQDRSGVLAFADGRGVSVLESRRSSFNLYDDRRLDADEQAQVNIRALHQDRLGQLWIGSLRGLLRLDRQSGELKRYFNRQLGPVNRRNCFGSICETRDGELFFGTWRGEVFRLDRARDALDSYLEACVKPERAIYDLLEDRQGELWLVTRGAGVHRHNRATGETRVYRHHPDDPASLPGDYLLAGLETPAGDLLFASNGQGLALWRRQTDRFQNYRHDPANPQSLSSNDVRALHIDRQARWWVGVHGGGLCRFFPERGAFQAYTVKDGLPDNVIYAILEDDHGFLWLSTNNGLARFDPETLAVRAYGVGDGLQSAEFNTGSRFRNDRGELFFGGIEGFNIFHPDRLPDNHRPPQTALTGVRVLGQELSPPLDLLELDHRRNFITFQFAALSFMQPHKNRYAYKLEGVDKEWVMAGKRRYANYTELDPGAYRFLVKAANNDGHWSQERVAATLIIKPPFWRTSWFIALAIAAALTLATIAYRLRVRANRRQKRVLEERVRLRTAQLAKAKSQAELANKLKSAFLAKMSHEIRTPLNAIIGFSEVLREAEVDEEQRGFLDIIQESSDTLMTLLNDILDFNRIEAHKLSIERIPFDPREVLERAARPFERLADKAGLRLKLRFDASLPKSVIGDPNRLKQIMFNLCSNAVKFTRHGGVEAAFSAETLENGAVALHGSVTDTGVGVAVERQERIFDSFTQADDSTTREYGGSGLGLTIVRELAGLMAGEVGVESPAPSKPFESPDPGSRFWFTINLVKARAPESEPDAEPDGAPRTPTGFAVLVAEDNRTNQILARKLLSAYTDRIHIVDNGQKAVEAVSQEAFDLVIMDIQMPVMDGYEATRRIKRTHPDLPVIGLSANVYQEAIEQSFAAGMDDHIGKPFKKAALEEALRQFVLA